MSLVHKHDHDFDPARRLAAALAVNTAFLLLEIVFGVVAGSMALLGDAGHNFSDSFALVLSLVAVRAMDRPKTESKTFGYHRMGIIVAFVNSLLIAGICFFLAYGAVRRFIDPVEVKGAVVVAVAGAGFLVNGSVALLLRGGRKDLNLRSAFLHLLTDALVSLGVVVSGLVVVVTGWTYMDPAITLGIALLVLVSAFQILRESTHILMESVPAGVDYHKIMSDIAATPGIMDVHDLHIWEIGSRIYSLSAHIVVEDAQVSELQATMGGLKEMLRRDHNVVHVTLEPETEACLPGEECNFR